MSCCRTVGYCIEKYSALKIEVLLSFITCFFLCTTLWFMIQNTPETLWTNRGEHSQERWDRRDIEQKTAGWPLQEAPQEKRRPQSWIQKWEKLIKTLLLAHANYGRALAASGFILESKHLTYQLFTLLKLCTAPEGLASSSWASHQAYIIIAVTFNQNSVLGETDVMKRGLVYFCTS